MKFLKNIYKIIRMLLVMALSLAVSLYILLYVLISIPAVQDKIKNYGEDELSKLLTTKVTISNITITPFSQILLEDVQVFDKSDKTALKVDKLGAGISLYNLLANGRLVFTFAEIIGMDANLYRENPDSPLNIQFIIDALNTKKPDSKPSQFDVKIYNIVIRKSNIKYDVLSEPFHDGRFDSNHIALHNITGDIIVPTLKNNDILVNVKRLAFCERSGLELKRFSVNFGFTDKSINVSDLMIELPNSFIAPENFNIEFGNLDHIKDELPKIPLDLKISNSYVSLYDLKYFVPRFAAAYQPINITLAINGTLSCLNIPVLNLSTNNNRLLLNVSGKIMNLDNIKNFEFKIPYIKFSATATEINNITSQFVHLKENINSIITNCGDVKLDGSLSVNKHSLSFIGSVFTSLGNVVVNTVMSNDEGQSFSKIAGSVKTSKFNVGELINKKELLGDVNLDVEMSAIKRGKDLYGNVTGNIGYVDFKGYRYNDIHTKLNVEKNRYEGLLTLRDENIDISLNGNAVIDGEKSEFHIDSDVKSLDLTALNLYNKLKNKKLGLNLKADFKGNDIDNISGSVSVDNFKVKENLRETVYLSHLGIIADGKFLPKSIYIDSDYVNGFITGNYHFKSLVPSIKKILSKSLPTIFPCNESNDNLQDVNQFNFHLSVKGDDKLVDLFKLPISPLQEMKIEGDVDMQKEYCSVTLDAPYLQQKDKLIQNSYIQLLIDGKSEICNAKVSTLYPNKKGNIAVTASIDAANDRIDSNINWEADREHKYNGNLNLSTLLLRDETQRICADVDFNPSDITFNDTTWNILPAKILLRNKKVEVQHFEARCDKQFIKIDGCASENPESQLVVDLEDVNLDYIFETLDISNVTFGGRGTGRFYASNIFSKIPTLATDRLHIDGFSYNSSLLGNADIKSKWNPETKGIELNADINQPNKLHSYVNGAIYPTLDSLYLDFKTNKLEVGFLQPFMMAFARKVSGYCSGNGTLFGTFKDINFKGDLLADNLKIKIGFTNVEYTCSDSVHIKPDLIQLDGIKLHDKFGHTANLMGYVAHRAFHDARFNIAIKNAKNLLCYDIGQTVENNWYGTIYGNGSATIKGEPGTVNIDVNMSTGDNSRFSFVLSNSHAANDYNFITFTDSKKLDKIVVDNVPEFVKRFNKKVQEESGDPTQVNMNLQIGVTSQTQMNLIMDPVGGDKIRARGSGALNLSYNSADNDVNIYGKYTLEKGMYNFTLQDIIIKDFTIKEGSSITFIGDPMLTNLDISAVYSCNASLTDLDESFALDKDMNRTNVPVHAVLKAKGVINQPAISFGLEFPTLTEEAKSKIKSIISTDEMLNRQIIYLVALNRFYTPEYMGLNSSNNSEFANVASSTISSQLSNMLGQINENWTIAPNFRTNKGDFSDVEVDLALSSQLLNNRLILNGNFGYRDKTLNSNSSAFIGDFDIEYLLTKNGTIRLKAYNRYNDQNYYVKSALTTQGVGVEFKYEFDSPFDFLSKKRFINVLKNKRDTINIRHQTIVDTIK